MRSGRVSEPTRVLFLLGSLGGGGSERQVIELLRRLPREQYAPALYLIYRTGELLEEVPADVPVFWYSEDPQATPRFNFPGRLLLAQGRAVARCLEEQRTELIYDRTSQMTLTAYLARRPRHVGRVSVAAGDPRQEFASAHYRFSLAKRLLLRRAYRDADRVLAVSAGVAQGLQSYFHLPPDKIETCYNVFDLARIEALSQAAPPELDRGRFHVVTVGRLQAEKGHLLLLQALDELVHRRGRQQLQLWILGQGPAEPELRAFVAEHRLEPWVQFLGFQKNPLPWVRAAHVFCLPSRYEGMPNALVEAMLCGTPVLATDCPSGPREILVDGTYGKLVLPHQPAALADGLDEAQQQYAAWQAVAAAARTHAERTYSVERGLARLQAVFTAVLAERGAARRRREA